MGIQLGLMEAQKRNIEADTAKKEADAEKTAGADTEYTKALTKLTKTEIDYKVMSTEEVAAKIKMWGDKSQLQIKRIPQKRRSRNAKSNPVEVALQQQSLGLQLKQIEAQNRLANAEATKTIAEANKIAGVDTKGQELQNKWQEIENRIQTST